MNRYKVTHHGICITSKIDMAATPINALRKTYGDPGDLRIKRHGFTTLFLRSDGKTIWFEVHPVGRNT